LTWVFKQAYSEKILKFMESMSFSWKALSAYKGRDQQALHGII